MGDTQAPGARQFIVFRIADVDCAFQLEAVQEILPMAKVAQLPGQPATVEGVLNLRGRAVPVVRLRRLFDLPASEPHLFDHVIVAKDGESVLGLVVDRVADTATVDAASLQPVSAGDSFNGCAEAQFTLAGGTVAVISLSRLLLVEERRRLADFQRLAQRRLEELEPASA